MDSMHILANHPGAEEEDHQWLHRRKETERDGKAWGDTLEQYGSGMVSLTHLTVFKL